MDGDGAATGLVPRIFARAFELFGSDADIKSFEINVQILELYNEQLQARGTRHAARGTRHAARGTRVACIVWACSLQHIG